jgi:hypothetical protein
LYSTDLARIQRKVKESALQGLAKGMGLHGDQGVKEVKLDGLYVIKGKR